MKIKTLFKTLLLNSLFTLSLSAQCSITNLFAEVSECDINGYVTIDFEFDVNDPGDDNMFSLAINGLEVSTYEYGETFYTYGPVSGNCETTYTITVTDQNDNDCNADFTFNEPFCCWDEGCNMVLDVDEIGECNNDGEFYLTILVANPGGSSGGFETVINGVSFGWLDYDQTYYEFGPLDGDCETIYEITVTDWEDETCTLTTTLNDPVCCTNCDNFIVDYVGTNDCTGSGTYFAEILIDNPGATNFEVIIDGISEGIYNYGDEVYTFGPFTGDCMTEHVFDVIDIEFGCESTIVLEPVCCPEYCSISDITVEAIECTGDNIFSIELNFEFTEVEEAEFDLWANGSYHGTYAYADLPIIIDDFPVSSDPFVTVFGTGADELCADDLAFEGFEECSGDCNISDVFAEAYACNDQGQIFVDIEFDIDNPGASNQFTINGNGTSYGTFEYGQTFYTVGPFTPDCNLEYEFVITDVDNNECSDFYVFNDVLCCEEGECAITTLDFGPNPECIDGLIVTEWLIDGENLSEVGFDIFINNVFETYVEWNDDSWYDFDIEDPGTEVFTIKVCDNDNEDCCNEWELENPCYEENEECSIVNLGAEAYDCNEDGEIYFDIFFEVENSGADNQFTVVGNGNSYGTFNYGEDYYTVGPFVADCETAVELIVTDVNNNDCTAFIGFDEIFCCEEGECAITTLDFGPNPECIDGLIVTEWLIDGENISEVGFDIFINDVFETYVEWNNDSWYNFDIVDPGTEVFTIKVCDNDNENCCIEWELENPCYDGNGNEECSISEVAVEQQECNDGVAFFHLTFDYENTGDDNQFTVVGNGNSYGTFEYGAPFFEIGPIESNCDLELEFIVTDVNFNECSAYAGYGPLCCDEDPECALLEIFAEPSDCLDGNTFNLQIDIEVDGDINDFFDLFIEEEFVGFYAFEELPILIEELSYDGEIIIIEICENDNPDCCLLLEVLNPCYEGGNEECSINEVSAEFVECDDIGEAYFHITFDYDNVGDDNLFTITGNGVDYGTFEYGEDFYSVGPVIADCETELEFIVTDVNNNDCSAFVEHDPACCEDDPDCALFEIIAEPSDCLDGNTFNLQIDIEVDGDINDFFDAFIEQEFVGFFAFEELPILIEDLSYDGEIIIIEICENDNPNCCIILEVLNPCYEGNGEECSINEVVAEFVECDENGEAYFHITFDYDNVGDDNLFTIIGNGVDYGTFEYGEDFYSVGPVIADCETELEFIVTDVNFNECSAFVGHDPACCEDEPDCALLEISLETTECLDDNTFELTIDVEVDGATNDFFDLFIEEEFIGFYEFAELPLVIEGLAYDEELITIELCENDNPDCCISINILNPCTEEENQQYFINEIEYELVACDDNMVTMLLDFSHGDNNDQFQINANGNSYGVFNYNDLPIMVENILADGITDYSFIIEDTSIEDLIGVAYVGTISCDGDVILDSDDITLDPANIQSIKAYDITGKLLSMFDSEESLRILDVDRSVSAGLIILRIDYGKQIVTKKIVRVH